MVDEGIGKLYRGVKPPLVQSIVSKSMMFGLYSWYHNLICQTLGDQVEGTLHLAAFLAGTTEALLTPFERAQTLLQIPKYNSQITGANDALRRIHRMGLREHYRGLTAVLLRNGPTNVCFFAARDPLRDALTQISTQRWVVDFVSGSLLGACLSTLFFPINVARSRMQSTLGGKYLSVPAALRLVYQERGSVRAIYRGVHINFSRSLLSWGIINSSYETLQGVL